MSLVIEMNNKRLADSSVPTKRRKHCTFSIAKKVEILRKIDQGTSVRNVCEEYEIGRSTVYDLIKQKYEVFSFFADSDSPLEMAKRKSMKGSKTPDLDKVMIDWFKQRRAEHVPLTGPMIIAQAKRYHEELNLTTPCKYTFGWLDKFKKRHGIRQIRIHGEKISADHDSAEVFIDEIAAIIKEENISLEQIYNADETALFWRYMPRKTLATLEEKKPSGVKDIKERLTVLACANAAGTHKLKLMIIGKSARPQSFKGVKIFPVIYKNNKRAWITQESFTDWYENHFIPEARNHCTSVNLPLDAKIMLIVDNCTAHPRAESLKRENAEVIFLPANCTSILQPLDCGVLRAFKCHYKNVFLQRMLDGINDEKDILQVVKEFTIKDALWTAANAWRDVSQETLKNAWRRLLPYTIFTDDDDDSENFNGFRISKEKASIFSLLTYAKDRHINLEESDIMEVMECDNDAPTINTLSDAEIMNKALNIENSDDDNEAPSDNEIKEERIPTDKLIGIIDNAIKGLEQRSFISEYELTTVRNIRDKLISERPKMKQLSLLNFMK